MEDKEIKIQYKEYDNVEQLNNEGIKLLSAAENNFKNAYAPYSNFQVSACLILDNNVIVKGTNVENASYPVSICAERTLLSHTVSNYPNNKIKKIAIYVDKNLNQPVPPCGLCRQTLLEVEKRQEQHIEIILVSKSGVYVVFEKCADLLPLYFDGEVL